MLNLAVQLTEVDTPHGVWPLYADRLGERPDRWAFFMPARIRGIYI